MGETLWCRALRLQRRTFVQHIHDLLMAPGEPFEMEEQLIDGRVTKVWKHAPRSLRALLEWAAAEFGDRTYVVLGAERVSYAEMARRAAAFAQQLVDLGVGRGDRVVIAMRNYLEWPAAFYGAVSAGAVAVPLNAWWTGEELAFGIADSGSRVIIADGERLARLRPHLPDLKVDAVIGVHLHDRPNGTELPDGIVDAVFDGVSVLPDVDVGPDDDAMISYTSGTTGHPKGVWSNHRQVCSGVWGVRFVGARGMAMAGMPSPWVPPVPGRMLVPVPLFHMTGCISCLLGQATMGGTIVLMRKWNAEEAVRLIEREQISTVSGVPTMMWDIVNAPNFDQHDLSSLRSLGGGGAATPQEFVRRVGERLPGRASSTGYGMTETSSLATSISGADYAAHPGSVGFPAPMVEIRIVDEGGVDVPAGETGEVWMRGVNIVKGYWNRPEATAETFAGGWLRSGDIGRLDDEGYLYIVDRLKDMLIRGGENISSAEVEAALFSHPDVLEAAVIGVPHDTLGEEVGAVVYLRPGATPDVESVRAHVSDRLAGFKVPTRIWFWDGPLPRIASGKVLKRELRTALLSSD
jgi:long-chain acyl-CoA synthetase